MAKELLSYRLNTYHNLYFYLDLMKQIRKAIEEGTFRELKAKYEAAYGQRQG